MSFLNTTRTFLIDDSDKELFIMMKSIVDEKFPTAVIDKMLLELYKICWEKKKRIQYREIGENTIYINFPPMNPIMRLFGGIILKINLWINRNA